MNVVADVAALPDSRSRFGDVSFNVGAQLDYDYRTKRLTVSPGGIVVGAFRLAIGSPTTRQSGIF